MFKQMFTAVGDDGDGRCNNIILLSLQFKLVIRSKDH